jgi:ABC-type lipoprotein export system ATPase subunit
MLVSVRNLSHQFTGTDVLFEHLDYDFEPGHTLAVCGPSGCGKSTLLSILAGWEKPAGGTVTREGVNRIGWVFQNPYGVPERSALDHVVFPLLARGEIRADAEQEALEAMDLFDLAYAANRQFADLSGGEAQRLMLARAVCSHPDMLLVDEPTAQLDMRTAHSVSHVLGNLAGQGMIVVVATHDPDTRDACESVLDLADYAPHENAVGDGSDDTANIDGADHVDCTNNAMTTDRACTAIAEEGES